MHWSALLLTLSLVVSCAHAHMYLASVYVGGQQKTCVRPHPTNAYDFPLSDKSDSNKRLDTTTDMICGWPPALTGSAPTKCPVEAGSSIQVQWWHANPNDDVVDGSHHGPCLIYMAKSDSGTGAVWFKIYEEGFNTATGEWCTDRIRKDGANKGRVDVTIPSDLAPGNYLLRSEFFALHEGYTLYGAQPYVGCLELTITGTGSADPSSKVNIVGLYSPNDPGLLFNIYNQPGSSYPIPGPRPYVAGSPQIPSTTGSTPSSTTGSTQSSTTGSTPSSTTGSPTSNPTVAPTSPPTSGNNSCAIGSVGCACSGGQFCNFGLGCSGDICLPRECYVGSEKCSCTQGGVCDTGLTCLSELCVNAEPLVASIRSSAFLIVPLSFCWFVVMAFVL